MTELGCAASYSVAFHDRRGQVQAGAALEPSKVAWERVLDGTGEAAVTVPLVDPGCCDTIRRVSSWANDLSIYRDDTDLVWQGPVVNLKHEAGQSTITARDVTAWLAKRVLRAGLNYAAGGLGAADLAVIAEAIVRQALAADDPNILDHLLVTPTGVVGERTYDADSGYAGDQLTELARTGVDFTALGHRLIIGPETPLARLAELTDDDFLGALAVEVDGLVAVTRSIVAGEGVTAAAGGAGPDGLLLDSLTTEQSIKDAGSAQAEADARVAAGWPPPVRIDVPAGVRLAPTAPVTVSSLVPGVVVPVSSTQTCLTVSADMRLTKVAVTFDKAGEKVAVTLAAPTDGDAAA